MQDKPNLPVPELPRIFLSVTPGNHTNTEIRTYSQNNKWMYHDCFNVTPQGKRGQNIDDGLLLYSQMGCRLNILVVELECKHYSKLSMTSYILVLLQKKLKVRCFERNSGSIAA